MIDIHNHLLFNVDDGSSDLNYSIALLNKLKESGITDVILTPHYIKNSSYNSRVLNNTNKLELLRSKVEGINLYLGNECYIDSFLLNLIKEEEITSLNNSKYLLIELPVNNKINNLENIIFELRDNGIIPIIAHPERYVLFDRNLKYMEKLKTMGVMYQGNLFSLTGKYGIKCHRRLKKMLKNNLIDFIATDIHHSFDKNNYLKAISKLDHIVGKESRLNLTENNPRKIIGI